jgi:polyisoprenoid-binding protein YceI
MAKLTYKIDPVHSSAHFSVRHMMITNVRGEFTKLSGTILWDPANPGASTIEATIDAASIGTHDDQRDTHLKSADFLDVEKFPTIAFRSKEIAGAGGELEVVGELTIHGVSRDVALEVEGPSEEMKDPWGNLRIGATAATKLNRKDFGLVWNSALETGGVLVGDEVKVTLEVQAIRQS